MANWLRLKGILMPNTDTPNTTVNNTQDNNAPAHAKRGKPAGTVAAKYSPEVMRPYLTRVYGELPAVALDALSLAPNVRKEWIMSPEFAQWDADKDAKIKAAMVAEWRNKVGKMSSDERDAIIRAIVDTSDPRERTVILAELAELADKADPAERALFFDKANGK